MQINQLERKNYLTKNNYQAEICRKDESCKDYVWQGYILAKYGEKVFETAWNDSGENIENVKWNLQIGDCNQREEGLFNHRVRVNSFLILPYQK